MPKTIIPQQHPLFEDAAVVKRAMLAPAEEAVLLTNTAELF